MAGKTELSKEAVTYAFGEFGIPCCPLIFFNPPISHIIQVPTLSPNTTSPDTTRTRE
jgi:hypothetical protein